MTLYQHYILSLTLTAITVFVLALFVAFQKVRKDIKWIFVLYFLSISIWSSGQMWALEQKNYNFCLLLVRNYCHSGVIFIPILFVHFVLILLNKFRKKRRFIYFSYFLGFVFLILNNFTSLIVKGAEVYPPIFNFVYLPGYLHPLLVVFFISLVMYGNILLFKGYKNAVGQKYMQLKWLCWITILAYIGGPPNFLLGYRIQIPWLMPFGTYILPIFVAGTAYAIVRYRLMDINIALTRAGIFAVVYSLVLGVPFWLGYTTKSWFSSTILAVFLATLGPFIYNYLRHHAEEILLKYQRRYQRALRELSRTMTRIRDLDKLLRMIVLTVVDTVKVPYAGIYLKDEEYKYYRLKHYYPKSENSRFPEFISFDSPLIKIIRNQKKPIIHEELDRQIDIPWESGLVIPCFMEDELLGFLVMGAKPHNHIYTDDDIIVFETLSYSTSLAIENCRFWKEIEDRQRKARLQEMDTYSYSLAHEIDNPMQIILGYTELLQGYLCKELNLPPEKQKEAEEAFGYILEATKRVSSMVKAIRDFGQKTTGELRPLKVEDVVESFSRLYFPQFKTECVNFLKELPSQTVYIRGEKPELMQVLVILANNSLHAMRYAEDKRIFLKVEQFDPDTVRMIFQDNGCGIKNELLPIIFSPFTTTKASSEGTGMGLYNAKKIIERHKGRIWAESEGEDKGATFFIELPIAKDIKPQELEGEDKGKRLF